MPLYQYQLYQYWYQLWQPRSRCVPFSPPFLLFLIPSFCLFLILYLPLLDFLSSFRSISTFYFPLMLFSPTPFSIPSLSFSLNAFAHSPLPFPSPSALLFLLFSLSRPPFSPSSISPSFFRFTPLLTLSKIQNKQRKTNRRSGHSKKKKVTPPSSIQNTRSKCGWRRRAFAGYPRENTSICCRTLRGSRECV